jgi:thiamine-monophosphate kinase
VGEFELIARYFARPVRRALLGGGDDCALLSLRPGFDIAISTDMLVSGRHFLADADPHALGYKTLAVNLSDLAAMGATPLCFTLAVALPGVDEPWLAAFSEGLYECANGFSCELVGGDTTRGPLNLCVTVFGEVPVGMAIRRDGARTGDDIWVSGVLGSAALGLQSLLGQRVVDATERAGPLLALNHPVPRISLGCALRGIASAMIDVSDGLVQDLGHILVASNVGAHLDASLVPIGAVLAKQAREVQLDCALAGGDDYELCFTSPQALRSTIAGLAVDLDTPVTCIGQIESVAGLRVANAHGGATDSAPVPIEVLRLRGYDHFA